MNVFRAAALSICIGLLGCHSESSSPSSVEDAGASDGDIDSDASSSLTPDDFDRQAALADCTFYVRCGIIGASEKAACEDAVIHGNGLAPDPYSTRDAVAKGRMGFDQAAAKRCLDVRASRGCTPDLQMVAAAVCDGAYVPKVALGGTCLADQECTAGHCDRGANARNGCTGTCVAFAAVGDACSSTSPCGPDAFCDSTKKTCVARSKAGETCGADGPFCAPGTFCKPATNTCGGRGAVGDRCSFSLFGSDCAPELFCDDSGATPACHARLANGEACRSFTACQDGLDCVGLTADDTGAVTKAGACTPFLDVGAACTAAGESGCPSDTSCASSKCTATGGLDAGCTSADCADGYYCEPSSKKCRPRLALGAACTPLAVGAGNPCVATTQCDTTTKVCTLICK